MRGLLTVCITVCTHVVYICAVYSLFASQSAHTWFIYARFTHCLHHSLRTCGLYMRGLLTVCITVCAHVVYICVVYSLFASQSAHTWFIYARFTHCLHHSLHTRGLYMRGLLTVCITVCAHVVYICVAYSLFASQSAHTWFIYARFTHCLHHNLCTCGLYMRGLLTVCITVCAHVVYICVVYSLFASQSAHTWFIYARFTHCLHHSLHTRGLYMRGLLTVCITVCAHVVYICAVYSLFASQSAHTWFIYAWFTHCLHHSLRTRGLYMRGLLTVCITVCAHVVYICVVYSLFASQSAHTWFIYAWFTHCLHHSLRTRGLYMHGLLTVCITVCAHVVYICAVYSLFASQSAHTWFMYARFTHCLHHSLRTRGLYMRGLLTVCITVCAHVVYICAVYSLFASQSAHTWLPLTCRMETPAAGSTPELLRFLASRALELSLHCRLVRICCSMAVTHSSRSCNNNNNHHSNQQISQ